MLMSLFQGAQARRRGPTSSVDATIRRVAAAVWTEVGTPHGLELTTDPELALRGTVRGVVCEVALVGEGAATFTLGKGTHGKSLGGRLAIAPVTLGRAVAARVTGRRVRIGDREIDESFVILSDSPSLADAFLGDDLRTALLAMRSRNPHIEIEGDAITVELEGTEMVHENLHAIVALLSRVPGPTPRA
jgi:hypothetical protein